MAGVPRRRRRGGHKEDFEVVSEYVLADVFITFDSREYPGCASWNQRWAREFVNHPTFIDNDFLHWWSVGMPVENEGREAHDTFPTLREAVLTVATMLARCYARTSQLEVLRMLDSKHNIPRVILISKTTFFDQIIPLETDEGFYKLPLRHLAARITVDQIKFAPARNVLIAPPASVPEVSYIIGMQHGPVPILDDAERETAARDWARRYCVPYYGETLAPVEGEDRVFTEQPEIIGAWLTYLGAVHSDDDPETVEYLDRCAATLIRAERLRMMLLHFSRVKQVGKTTLINTLRALGLTVSSISSADFLVGQFNKFVGDSSLVFAEELTTNPKMVSETMSTCRAISTAEEMLINPKGRDGHEMEVMTNIAIATNGMGNGSGTQVPIEVDFGDERTAFFFAKKARPEVVSDIYRLIKDPKQRAALFFYLTFRHRGTVYNDVQLAAAPAGSFNACERPRLMLERLGAYAYARAPPLTKLIANTFRGGIWSPLQPGTMRDGMFSKFELAAYMRGSGIKEAEIENVLGIAVADGLLQPVSGSNYVFGPNCAAMFCMGGRADVNVDVVLNVMASIRATPAEQRGDLVMDGVLHVNKLVGLIIAQDPRLTPKLALQLVRAAERRGLLHLAETYHV